MISKEKRWQVYEHLLPYFKYKDTTKELKACCDKVKCDKINSDEIWCTNKHKCPIFQLWLSYEYLHWCDSYSQGGVQGYC